MDCVIDQTLSEGQVEAEDGKLDFEELSDDEEVALHLPRKGADERDLPGVEIRDVPEAPITQRSLCTGLGARGSAEMEPGGTTHVGDWGAQRHGGTSNRRHIRFGCGGAQSSGSTVATTSLRYAGDGGSNTTKERCGWTQGPPGSWDTFPSKGDTSSSPHFYGS